MESKNKILWELKVEYDGAVEQLRKYSNEVLKIEEDLDKKLAKKNQLIGKAKVMKGKISDETDEKKASKMQAEYGETVDKIRKVGAEVKKLENQFDLKKAQKEYFTKKTDGLKSQLEAETEKTQGVQETTQAQEETKEAVQETVQAKEQERQEIEKVGNEAVDMQKLQAEAAEKAKQVYEDEQKEIERLGAEIKKISENKSLTRDQKNVLEKPFKDARTALLLDKFDIMQPKKKSANSISKLVKPTPDTSTPAVEEKVAEKAAEATEEVKALNEQLEKQEEVTTQIAAAEEQLTEQTKAQEEEIAKVATAEEILNENLEKNKKLAIEAAREMSNKYDMFNVKQSVETAKNDMKVGLKEIYDMYGRGFPFDGGGGTAATNEKISREALIKDMNSVLERDAKKTAVAYEEVYEVLQRVSEEIARIKATGLPMQEQRDLMAPFEGKYNQLEELADRTKVFKTELLEAGNAAKKLSRNVKSTGYSMKDLNKGIRRGMLSIIKYGLGFRSVYFFVRKIREVIINGLKEFAKFDAKTNKTMTNLSNSLSNLKASLISAFSPIMSALEPALVKIMSALEKAFDYIGMFFAVLRGDSTYKKAIAVQRNYADALNDTAKAAKEAKTYLSGLDEIRVYDTGKDTSSSSGSGSGESNLLSGIKEVEIPDIIKSIVSKLKIGFDSIEMAYNSIKPEQVELIFKTLFAGLVGGSLMSFILGPAGFVGGFLIGVGLELFFESMKQLASSIKPETVTKIFETLFAGLVGGAFMSLVLGPAGFVGGFLIGVGIKLAFDSIKQLANNIKRETVSEIFKTLFAGLVGAAFFGIVLGPAGIIGGFVIGAGLFMLFKSLDGVKKFKTQKFLDILKDIFKKTAGLSFLSVIPGAQGLISIYFTLRSVLKLFFGDKDVQVDEDGTVAGKVDKFGEDITGQMEQVGEDTEEGFWTGFQKRADSSKKVSPLGKFINAIIGMFRGKDGFDCHSPSKVMADIGENVVDGLVQGFQSAWTKIKIMMSLVQHAADQMRSMFNFEWSLPRIKLPHFYWDWVQVGNLLSLPRISVQWYAKGGIVDSPTLFGAGEAGKEAVIPLERNTEWIRKVAEELADILVDRLGAILNSYPMPAVASGTLIPPRIEVDIDGLDAIDGKLSQIIDRMGSRGGSYSFTAQLNRKTLFSEMISEAKVQQSTTGRNPFDLR